MGSVFSADPKPGGASTEMEENSASVGFDYIGVTSETEEILNQSASNLPQFLVPAQKSRTCEG